MLFDTDVLIWALKGNRRAAQALESTDAPHLSVVSYIELLQGAQDKRQCGQIRDYLAALSVQVLALSENIGHRAVMYIQEHALGDGLRLADALIAATAVEHPLPLCTGNHKHFKPIMGLDVRAFRA